MSPFHVFFSSSTYQSAERAVAVKYTQGEWEGELGSDHITIPQGPSGTIIINIAAILVSEGFFLPEINWQGILGLAYPLLARVSNMKCFSLKVRFSRGRCNCLTWVRLMSSNISFGVSSLTHSFTDKDPWNDGCLFLANYEFVFDSGLYQSIRIIVSDAFSIRLITLLT